VWTTDFSSLSSVSVVIAKHYTVLNSLGKKAAFYLLDIYWVALRLKGIGLILDQFGL